MKAFFLFLILFVPHQTSSFLSRMLLLLRFSRNLRTALLPWRPLSLRPSTSRPATIIPILVITHPSNLPHRPIVIQFPSIHL
jgi:hypothetical protein